MGHEKTVSVSKIRILWEPWKEDESPRNVTPVTVSHLLLFEVCVCGIHMGGHAKCLLT